MDNLLKEFEIVRKSFVDALKKFPPEKAEEKLFDKWSLKEVVAHFTAWDRYFTQSLKLLKNNVSMPYWENIASFNKNAVIRTAKADWQKVFAEFVKSGEMFLDEYKKLPKDLIDKLIWKERKYTPFKFLEINVEHYKNAQLKEIQKLLKKWKIN